MAPIAGRSGTRRRSWPAVARPTREGSTLEGCAPGRLIAMEPDQRRLEVWRTFLQSHAAVMDVLGREVQAEHALPLTWYDVLVQLHHAGGRLRMIDLANSVLISKSGLTRLVDRMEAAGFVGREPCEGDRRGTMAVLLAPGKQALNDAAPDHLRGVEEHFTSMLADDELTAVEAFLRRVVDRHSAREVACDDLDAVNPDA